MTDDSANGETKPFTSQKLDWLDGVAIDPCLEQAAIFKIAFCIAQHVNARTGLAILSDQVIHEKTNISVPQIKRHRTVLRDTKWLDWVTRKGANHYRLLSGPLERAVDLAIMRRDARKDLQKTRRKCLQKVSPVTLPDTLKISPAIPDRCSKVPPATLPEVSPATLREVSPANHIHLRDYTLGVTPSKDGPTTERIDLDLIDWPDEVATPLQAGEIEQPFNAIKNPQIAETRLIAMLGDEDVEDGISVARAITNSRFEFLRDRLTLGQLVPSDIEDARRVAREAERGVSVR